MSYSSSMLSGMKHIKDVKTMDKTYYKTAMENMSRNRDGRTYWVSFFRRTRISWSTGKFMISFLKTKVRMLHDIVMKDTMMSYKKQELFILREDMCSLRVF